MSTANGPDPKGPGLFKRLNWNRVRRPRASNVADISRSLLGVAKEAAPGPSKSVLAGVSAAWDVAERIKATKERAQDLASRTKGMRDKLMTPYPDGAGIAVDVQQFLNILKENHQQIEPILHRSRIAGLLNLHRDEKRVSDASRRTDEEVNDVQALLSASTHVQVAHMQIQVTKLGKDVDDLKFLMRCLIYTNVTFVGLF
ncbi:hypothetical protein H0H92_014371 [Tricholoma furcatifolium]|nr:hypothetical protein H0H92_014371 [Tricholoma furcatifolium]